MKKSEIKIGGHYQVRMNRGHIDTVKVEKIVGKGSATRFHVISEDGETDVLKSCQRFLSETNGKADEPDYTPITELANGPGAIRCPGCGEIDWKIKRDPIDPYADRFTCKQCGEKWTRNSGEEIGTHRRKAASLLESAGLNEAIAVGPHIIVEARAGSGKTTTLVEGLKRLKGISSSITPSPQQAAVWDAMAEGPTPSSIAFVAFNKSIATELQSRVPAGCSAMTMHSLGYASVRERFGRVKVQSWRVSNIISEILETDIRELRKNDFGFLMAVEKLVGLCKMNLSDCTEESMEQLSSYYEVDLNGSRDRVFDLVPQVIERCKNVGADNEVDFNDMIWLPVALNLPVQSFDLLLVDEAQDLNRCQQQLALKAGRRLVLCGDPCQAIYGFAGADSESMDRMYHLLSTIDAGEYGRVDDVCGPGVIRLPLNETRRCGKAIVAEAQKIVPEFYAHESNGEGIVSRLKFGKAPEGATPEQLAADYREVASSGDMVLCRVNAPLVSECFRFLKAGRKANIQGRDIGQGLISTIKKLKADDITDLAAKLSDWMAREVEKEQAKRNPSEARIIGIQDRHDCIMYFMEDAETVEDVIAKIEDVFTDDRHGEGIKLSSIHKAKGLEASRVFLLEPKGATVPHPMAKSKWQREQEYNLRYVAITRAITELVFVTE